ncbi:MAG: hypothetical protein ACM3NO_02185 [Deltaproteobacteria bacterium]
MSNRWVFLSAFLTAVLIIAGAFTLSQFFYFELAKSVIFVAIAMLVFFNEDEFGYMLGMVFPPLWFLVDLLMGTLVTDFTVMYHYLTGKSIGMLASPADGFARIVAVFLFFSALHAWRKEVPEKLIGKTFWISFAISVAYVGLLGFWYMTRVAR